MAFSDARNERDRADTGKNSDNHGNRGDKNNKAEKNNREAMSKSKGTGSGSSSKAGNYSDARDDPVAKEQNARNSDARNEGESWGDGLGGIANEIGHMIGGLLGLDEEEQSFTEVANDMARPEYNGPAAGTPDNMRGHWSVDPMQALANFAGMATGLPVGSVYGVGKYAYESMTGNKLGTEIDLGRSVLDREDTPATQGPAGNPNKPTRDNVSSGETKTGGLQTDKGGKNNGLLGQPNAPKAPPAKNPTPTTPHNPTTPTNPVGQAGGFPKPGERFTAPTYYAGNWVRDPATQEVKWKPHAEGLLA